MHLGRIVIAAVVSAVAVNAQTPVSPAPARAALLVSTTWVGQHLKDPDLVLLHVGDKAEYDARHLPGARFVAFAQVAVTAGAAAACRSKCWRRTCCARGSPRSASRPLARRRLLRPRLGVASTRVILTLDHAGLGPRTSLLDGGHRRRG